MGGMAWKREEGNSRELKYDCGFSPMIYVDNYNKMKIFRLCL